MKLLLAITMLFSLAGCVSYSPSIPEGYIGDTATIDDSFQRQSGRKANFYYIKLIDGKPIYNSLVATSNASYGKGSQLIAMGASRPIPIKPLSLYIVGQLHHSAPIGAMLNSGSNYIVEGEVNFTPEKDEMYIVSGRLSEASSAVWIEDISGNIVSKIIELNSSSYDTTMVRYDKKKMDDLPREDLFLNLASGESKNLIIAKLGEPDSISKYGGNFLIEKPPSVTYQYEGLGSIQFSARNSEALFVEKVIPSIKQSANISSIQKQLGSNGQTLQSIAKGYYQHNDLDIDMLDLFAEKIWTDKNTEDPYTVDALSWLCKVLAKSNNSRYRSLLQNVANVAGESKLRKYAASSLNLLPTEETEQFLPAGG